MIANIQQHTELINKLSNDAMFRANIRSNHITSEREMALFYCTFSFQCQIVLDLSSSFASCQRRGIIPARACSILFTMVNIHTDTVSFARDYKTKYNKQQESLLFQASWGRLELKPIRSRN